MSTPQQAVCPQCGGTGWKDIQTPQHANTGRAGGPGESGGARRVTRCDCVVGARAQKLLERARIPARYEHCELTNYATDFPGQHPSQQKARVMAEKFVEEYPLDEHMGLLFIGDIGVGKTHLAVGILKELIRRKGVLGLYYDYRELLKEIQNSFNPQVQTTEMQVLQPVFGAEVLLLDELGAVKPTEWVWDTVSHILNQRYNEKLTTIITTNFPDQPAAKARSGSVSDAEVAKAAAREGSLGDRIGERLRSRLHEMCKKVEMSGDDFRKKYRSASFR